MCTVHTKHCINMLCSVALHSVYSQNLSITLADMAHRVCIRQQKQATGNKQEGGWGRAGRWRGEGLAPSREAHLLGLGVALLCPSVADSPCKGHPCGHAKVQWHAIRIPVHASTSYAWLLACQSVRVIASDSTHGRIRYTSTSHCMSKSMQKSEGKPVA